MIYNNNEPTPTLPSIKTLLGQYGFLHQTTNFHTLPQVLTLHHLIGQISLKQ